MVVRVTQASAVSPFDRKHITSYLHFIETMYIPGYLVLFSRYTVASYLSKITNFSCPVYIWCLHWGWPQWSVTKTFGNRKAESLCSGAALFAW